MDRDTLFIIALGVAAVLALLNAYRGAVLIRGGEMSGGRKHLVLGLTMLLIVAIAVYIRPTP